MANYFFEDYREDMENKFIKFLRDHLWGTWIIISIILLIVDSKAEVATWVINLILIGITAYVIKKINFSLKQVKEILKDLENPRKENKISENSELRVQLQ